MEREELCDQLDECFKLYLKDKKINKLECGCFVHDRYITKNNITTKYTYIYFISEKIASDILQKKFCFFYRPTKEKLKKYKEREEKCKIIDPYSCKFRIREENLLYPFGVTFLNPASNEKGNILVIYNVPIQLNKVYFENCFSFRKNYNFENILYIKENGVHKVYILYKTYEYSQFYLTFNNERYFRDMKNEKFNKVIINFCKNSDPNLYKIKR